MKHCSLKEFADVHNLNKTTVWRRAKELGINTSQGLSPTDQEILKTDFRIIDNPLEETALVPVHHAELVPLDQAETLHWGNGTTVNITIHTGAADTYNADAINTRANVQAMLQTILNADEERGRQDALEIQAAADALKQKRLEKVLGGHAKAGNEVA